jgi:hypothetical protein
VENDSHERGRDHEGEKRMRGSFELLLVVINPYMRLVTKCIV